MMYIEPTFAKQQNNITFDTFMHLEGELFRTQKSRKTLRFVWGDKRYFLKIHRGMSFKELLKHALHFRKPVVSARDEWEAIAHVRALDVPTLTPVVFGERGRWLLTRESFLVTEALEDTLSLDEFLLLWQDNPKFIAIKRALIYHVARIARTLHEAGLNHRDFYLCHFLLALPEDGQALDLTRLKIYLIDLHRMQKRPGAVPFRWRVKDIGALYFSSMGRGLVFKDYLRFLKVYYQVPTLRELFVRHRRFLLRLRREAEYLHHKWYGTLPAAKYLDLKGQEPKSFLRTLRYR